jgi:hypothetical protein
MSLIARIKGRLSRGLYSSRLKNHLNPRVYQHTLNKILSSGPTENKPPNELFSGEITRRCIIFCPVSRMRMCS